MIVQGLKESVSETDNKLVERLAAQLGFTELKLIDIFRHKKTIGSSNTGQIPILNIELALDADKAKFSQKEMRDKIDALTGDFDGIKIFPDRTYKERMEFKFLRSEQEKKNAELLRNGNTEEKYIIKDMRLVLKRIQA